MVEISEETKRNLARVIMPTVMQRMIDLEKSKSRLVYYTSAEVALDIIKNRELWLRDAACMNDYSEMSYGLQRVADAFSSTAGIEFRSAVDRIFPDVSESIEDHLKAGVRHTLYRTYMICFSEHLKSENEHGRLSMWRAYGGNSGVAVVFNAETIFSPQNALDVNSVPVLYWEQQQMEAEFSLIANNIISNEQDFRQLGSEHMSQVLFNVLRYLAICSKHPGFKEEREWRVVYSPTVQESKFLKRHSTSLNGIPQTVYKLPLENRPDDGLTGMEVPEIIDRVIVGPTQFSSTICEAIETALTESDVKDAASRVFVSDIPLRH